jgi:hypothetical protein
VTLEQVGPERVRGSFRITLRANGLAPIVVSDGRIDVPLVAREPANTGGTPVPLILAR